MELTKAKQSSFTVVVSPMQQNSSTFKQISLEIQSSPNFTGRDKLGVKINHIVKLVSLLHADTSIACIDGYSQISRPNWNSMPQEIRHLWKGKDYEEVHTDASCETASTRESFTQWQTKMFLLSEALRFMSFHKFCKQG